MWPSIFLTVAGLAGIVVGQIFDIGWIALGASTLVMLVGILAVLTNMGPWFQMK